MKLSKVVALGLVFAASAASSFACGEGDGSTNGTKCDCLIGFQLSAGKKVESCTLKVRTDSNGNRLYNYCDCALTGGDPYNDQPACE